MEYDSAAKTMQFTCPACGMAHDYDVASAALVKLQPDRHFWALSIGACPGCGSTHHMNCNLPDDHPDAEHINALLLDRNGGPLPKVVSPSDAMRTSPAKAERPETRP